MVLRPPSPPLSPCPSMQRCDLCCVGFPEKPSCLLPPSLKHSPGLFCWATVQRVLDHTGRDVWTPHRRKEHQVTASLSAGKTAQSTLQVTHFVSKCSPGDWLTEAEGPLEGAWRVIWNSRPSPINPSWPLMWASQIGPDLELWNELGGARSLSSWTSLAGVERGVWVMEVWWWETSGRVGCSFCWGPPLSVSCGK